MGNPNASSITPAPSLPRSTTSMLLRVAWWSIAVGLALEAVLLAMAAIAGKAGSISPFVADLVQKVSWSYLVCMGLAVGAAVGRAARGALMGLMGLLSAPVAFAIARALHKGATKALDIEGGPAGPSPWLLAGIKAVQYGCFGLILAWAVNRYSASLKVHLSVGALVAIVFGGIIVGLSFSQTPTPAGMVIATRAVNELLFPLGCAFALFAASAVAEKATGVED